MNARNGLAALSNRGKNLPDNTGPGCSDDQCLSGHSVIPLLNSRWTPGGPEQQDGGGDG